MIGAMAVRRSFRPAVVRIVPEPSPPRMTDLEAAHMALISALQDLDLVVHRIVNDESSSELQRKRARASHKNAFSLWLDPPMIFQTHHPFDLKTRIRIMRAMGAGYGLAMLEKNEDLVKTLIGWIRSLIDSPAYGPPARRGRNVAGLIINRLRVADREPQKADEITAIVVELFERYAPIVKATTDAERAAADALAKRVVFAALRTIGVKNPSKFANKAEQERRARKRQAKRKRAAAQKTPE